MRRRTNYELADAIRRLLSRLTANGTHRDRAEARDLVHDLHSRLCPAPPDKKS